MPRKLKTANEMTDKELMEKTFSKRVVKELGRELGLDEDENGEGTATTPTDEESSG
jgi:hypothetical protein